MTILIVPNLTCNLRCRYCYADCYDWKDKTTYDLSAILATMQVLNQQRLGDSFCLHGGECTTIDRRDFETLLKRMYELTGKSSVQTNCFKIDEDLIRMFKAYKTSVGVSIDGDNSLNSLRGFPNDTKKTKQYTNQVINNIFLLREQGVSVSALVVLTKVNAGTNAKLRRLLRFILRLRQNGIKSGRLNLMWSNRFDTREYELSPKEASYAWLYLYNKLKKLSDLHWQPFREFTDNLLGFKPSCSYGNCNFESTSTKAILPDGSVGNCCRTHQDGTICLACKTCKVTTNW